MGEDLKYCDNCKREVSAANFTVHSVHCNRNLCVCGVCGEAVARSRYQQHLETDHTPAPCDKCGEEVEPLQIFSHQKETCPRRLVACQHCELEVTAGELPRHVEYCEARTERCKGCTKYVQVKHLQFHYEHDHKYLRPEDKPERNGSDDEGTDECPICLGPVTLPLCLECGHTFCMVCVKGIANTTKNCAICRRDIPRDMLMDIRFCREEDIIKNYVNKPRIKKNTRSHSVPSRPPTFSYTSTSTSTPTPAPRRLVHHTTQDYDDMVNALLSSRTSSTSYRYQRPANTHTPSSYTPYSTTTTTSTTSSCQDSCKDSDKDDDDCCCSSTRASTSTSTPSSTTTTTTNSTQGSISTAKPSTTSTSKPSTTTSRSSSTNEASSRNTNTPSSSNTTSARVSSTNATSTPKTSTSNTPTTTTTSSYSNGARPRRPTSLALETSTATASLSSPTSSSNSSSNSSSSSSISSRVEGGVKTGRPPRNATQEEYDRWLAFQLAKAEDDLPPSEFNRKHVRPSYQRSVSMPERAESSTDSSSSDTDDSRSPTRRSSRRPPAIPRSSQASASASSVPTSKSTPISKSSSDSKAGTSRSGGSGSSSNSSSSSSVLSTGARPKITGLKKRVSFKEDTPPVRREAPVLLPCEFCEEVFPERDLMRHQTSCEHNETQLPRTSRLAHRAASSTPTSPTLTSPTRTIASPIGRVSSISPSASTSGSPLPAPRSTATRTPTPVCAPPRKTTVANPASTAVPLKTPEGSNRSPALSSRRRSPTLSPPPGPPTTTITIVDQPSPSVVSPGHIAASSRPFSVSPAPSSSNSSGSVSSSSSASPIPTHTPSRDTTLPDTPTTDLEIDMEDEDTPYMRPRKGRLLSSAIFSWRNISATGCPKRGYVRSNTAPLEDTGVDEDHPSQPVTTSLSASLLPEPPTSDSPCPAPDPPTTVSDKYIQSSSQQQKEQEQQTQQNTGLSQKLQESQSHQQAPKQSESQTNSQNQSQNTSQTTSAPDRPELVFIKNPNKYRAPPPPQTPPNIPASAPIITQKLTAPQKPVTIPYTYMNGHDPSQPTSKQTANTINVNTNDSTQPTSKQTANTINVNTNDSTQSSKTQQVNGYLKFDSKPMMNGYTQKELEDLIPCEFCKKVFSPEKFQSHQTMCEATYWPPALRPTSPPPPTTRITSPPPTIKPTSPTPSRVRPTQALDQSTSQKVSRQHPETKSPLPEPKIACPETRNPKPVSKTPRPETKSPRPESRSIRSGTTNSTTETNSTRTETKSSRPETKSPLPETKRHRPETQSPRPETKSPRSETKYHRSEVKASRTETKYSESESRTSRGERNKSPRPKSPIPARHKKGPAPAPPPAEETTKDSTPKTSDRQKKSTSPVRSRMERSHSVMDDRIYQKSESNWINRRLERTNSIKETSSRSRSTYYSPSSIARRWSSREFLHSNSVEPTSSYSSSGWSGSTSNLAWSGSNSNLYSSSTGGFTSGHGWSSHVNMVRDDVRNRAAASSSAASASSSSYYGGARYRDRSSSRPRPASLYTSSDTHGSLYDLHSPTRQFNITDSFSSASLGYKKRYIR